MQEKSEGRILSEVFQDVRSLTKYYLAKANEVDPYREYEINGKKLNSLYWVAGHITWAEHFLLVEGLTGEKMDIAWLSNFKLGSSYTPSTELPSMDEIHAGMDLVHKRVMRTLLALGPDELGQPNEIGLSFGGGDTKRVIIRHAIRHEPCHAGQIGWILKINGLETV